MNIYKFIEKNGIKLKKHLEDKLSYRFETMICISSEQWDKVIKDVTEDIEYNIISFNKELDEEYIVKVFESIAEINIINT